MGKEKMGLGILVLVIIFALLGIGCATTPATTPPTVPPMAGAATPVPQPTPIPKLERVKFQLVSVVATVANFYMGREKGIFREEGIDLEMTLMKSDLAVPALTAGEIDFAVVMGPPFTAALVGVPVKLLMNTIKKTTFHLIGGRGVNTVADLKGKTLAVTTLRGSEHFAASIALRQLGLDPDKDITVISIPAAEQRFVALRSNAVGSITVPAPYNIMAADEGFKVLAFLGDYFEVPFNGLAAADTKIKNNPGQTKRMIRATLKSMAYVRDHREEVEEYIMKLLNIDKKTAQASYNDATKAFAYDGAISDQSLQNLVEVGRASGAVKGQVDVKMGVNYDLLREVQKELKLIP